MVETQSCESFANDMGLAGMVKKDKAGSFLRCTVGNLLPRQQQVDNCW